jgi:hypothetical protein
MSVREKIASNIIATLDAMTSPVDLKKITREPFEYDRLSNAQFPAAWIQTGDELREDATIGGSDVTRFGSIDYRIVGFVKGATIDTARNQLIEAIENELDTDRTRGGNALDTQVVDVSTDEGQLQPIGGITMTIRIRYEYTRGAV